MEFSPEFAVIQGTLLTLQKKVGSLKNLTQDDSSNEENIQLVVKTLTKTLNSFENIDYSKDSIKLRQISLFLILNSNLKVCELLTEDANCGHLIDSAPVLCKDLMIDVFCQPVWSKYFHELLIYCPPVLGVELLDALASKIKRNRLTIDLSYLVVFITAIYTQLLTLHEKSNDHNCEIDCVALKYMVYYTQLLELFPYPESVYCESKISNFSEGFGCRLLASLELVTLCLKYYNKPQELDENMLDIYKMNVAFDYEEWHQQSDVSILETMHIQLFSVLLVQVVHITVDVWLEWAEINSKCNINNSLQKDIAEEMYKCHEVIMAAKTKGIISELLDELIPMLSSMASKPRDEDDEIKDADVTLILKRIPDDTFSQKKWMAALFKKIDDVITKEECVECIKRNIPLIDFEISLLFMEKIFKHIKNAKEDNVISEDVKNSFLSAVRQLCLDEQLQLLETFLLKFGISTCLCSSEYNSKMTKVLNTAVNSTEVSQDEKYMEFVNLSLQNPLDVMTRLLKHSVASDKQANIIGDVFLMLKPFHTLCVDKNNLGSCRLLVKILNVIMQKRSDMEFSDTSFISLVTLLATNDAIPTDHFLKYNLLPLVHKNLIDQNWSDVALWLEMLQIFVDGTVKSSNTLDIPALLFLLAQIMELSRQSLYSFSCAALISCEHAINIIGMLLESYVINVEEARQRYLCERIITWISPINRFYFFDLWSNYENYIQCITDWKVYLLHWKCDLPPPCGSSTNFQRNKIIFELAQLLPICAPSEWRAVAENLHTLLTPTFCGTSSAFMFECLIDAIQILALLSATPELTHKEQECAISCLDFCVKNLCVVTKEELGAKPECVTEKTASLLFLKIIDLYCVLPAVVQESRGGTLLNLLVAFISYSASDVENYSNEEDEEKLTLKAERDALWQNMICSVTMVEDLKIRQALARKLQENFNIVS